MSESILSVDQVDAFYGQIQALHGVSVDIREKQIVALLGSNGAGKTTTLKTISGLVRARRGRVSLLNEDITQKPAHEIARMGVVHVPEGRHVLKGMSVTENLELGGFRIRDHRERQRRIREVQEIFPVLRERRGQDASLLSGGEQQMLAIGRGLMAEPRVMLLDEPSMGLAPFLVTETMRIIKRLNDSGTTILLVEQNARLALKLAHYAYVLENGVVKMQGDGESLQRDEAIVQAYLGTSESPS
ncbi:MAG TPA: ABC transporter ATP-binding protein [Gammaproteobacteria bacterium]|nr:ABC transporter ATP-binding protein [Gammaproteobacteria bacterium]